MADQGHLKLSRKSFRPEEAGGCAFWNERREYSKWEAWVFLLQAAAWGEHEYTPKGSKPLQISRGETRPLSVRFLMDRWRWGSKKRVTGFLQALVKMDRLRVQQRTASGDTYVVVNYDVYQGGGDSSGYSDGAEAGTKEKQPKQINNQERDAGSAKPNAAAAQDRKKRAGPLPTEWEPNDRHREFAAERGLDLGAEVEKFRDWAEAKDERKANWDAAFRYWLRNARREAGAQLTVINGGLLEDREAKDREERARREAAEREREEAFEAWKRTVAARFGAEPEQVREQWKDKARPELRQLERFPEQHKKALKQRVYELYGAASGLPMPRERSA